MYSNKTKYFYSTARYNRNEDISEIKQHLLQSNSIVFSDKKAEIKDDIKDSNESSSMDWKEQLKRLLYQTTE